MEKKSKSYYKYCIVPMCKNNIITAPDKVYFHMPKDTNVRKKWCKAMRRDNVSCLSSLYCCEDHFNIENDTENYIKYKIMALEGGQRMSLLLKKGVVPHIFECPKKDELWPPLERQAALKRKHPALVYEALAAAARAEDALSVANLSEARPPSVSKSVPSTKEDVKQAKRIAALRIHVERVIGRLREFNMLLPHACVDHNLIHQIDEVIIIACGLINLQDVLIKK